MVNGINITGTESVVSNPPPPDSRLMKTTGWDGMSHGGKSSNNKLHGVLAKEKRDKLYLYEFQFNPPEMKGGAAAKWGMYNTPGSFLPIGSFMHMETPSTSLELFLDCTDSSSLNDRRMVNGQFMGVWADILSLLGFVNPDIRDETYDTIYQPSTGRFTSPSPVILCMGPIVLRTILLSVEWRISMWHETLVPLRAEVSLAFNEITSNLLNDFNRVQKSQVGSGKRLREVGKGAFSSVATAAAAYGQDSFFTPGD